MKSKTIGLCLVAMCGLTSQAFAQGPLNPLPVSVTLFPTTLGSQQAVGLSLGTADWDMSVSLPHPRLMQGLGLTPAPAWRQDEVHAAGAATVQAAWHFSGNRLGVNYRIDAASMPDAPAPRSLGLVYGYQFRSGISLSTSLDRGLGEGQGRWGGGLSISYRH
jgi:hypothetical protein